MKRSPSHQQLDDTETALLKVTSKLESIANSCRSDEEKQQFQSQMKGFLRHFKTFLAGQKDIDWAQIRPPASDLVVPLADLKQAHELDFDTKRAMMEKLVVLKLNGGLGTSMGCKGPKSVIEVHSGFTFLDLTIRQIELLNQKYRISVPLVLMNSFNTHEETEHILHKYESSSVRILTFNQNRYPRFYKETLVPCPPDIEGELEDWYPPGHGDVFSAFASSSIFEKLRKEGREVAFVSNIDNLGATVEFNILKHMLDTGSQYIMELTDKTRADVKGGTLIEYDGKARLLEIAQVPKSRVEEFKSIKKFKIFNTNNLWVTLDAVQHIHENGLTSQMEIIVNNKQHNGKAVIQLETAAGSAIRFFEKALGINVPRTRFLPVKGTSDLLLVQSNLYSLAQGKLKMNPQRPFPTVPLVKLGDNFRTVQDYQNRFNGKPDILELDHLTVSGDVTFGADVSLRGTVIIVANHGSRIDIPPGSILENKVVSGNMRILDH